MSDPVVLLSTGDVVGPAGGVTDNSMVLFSGTSGKLIKGNNAVVTSAGLALLDDVDAAAQRVTLGLGTAATSNKQTAKYDATAGSVLTVGAFGLGGAQAWITYNLDTLINTGVYYCEINSTNKPRSDYGHLQVYGGADTNYCVQIYDCVTTGAVRYIRYLITGVWGGWREIALTDSPAFIGTPTAPTAAAGTSTTQVATTAFVTTANNLKANINSPTFTGVPSAPTAAAGTNTTQLANTAFVKTAIDNVNILKSIGIDQTWQNLTAYRGSGVTYTNSTGRPIMVGVSRKVGANEITAIVNEVIVGTVRGYGLTDQDYISFIVPIGSTYRITATDLPIAYWTELR